MHHVKLTLEWSDGQVWRIAAQTDLASPSRREKTALNKILRPAPVQIALEAFLPPGARKISHRLAIRAPGKKRAGSER